MTEACLEWGGSALCGEKRELGQRQRGKGGRLGCQGEKVGALDGEWDELLRFMWALSKIWNWGPTFPKNYHGDKKIRLKTLKRIGCNKRQITFHLPCFCLNKSIYGTIRKRSLSVDAITKANIQFWPIADQRQCFIRANLLKKCSSWENEIDIEMKFFRVT